MWLDAHGRTVPFLLLYPAGLVSAFIGGLRWGFAANLLSTALAWYHLVPRLTSDDPWLIGGIAISTLGVLFTAIYRTNLVTRRRAREAATPAVCDSRLAA